MGESSQTSDALCRCMSLNSHASASGFIEGERVIAMGARGGISVMLASTMQEFAFIPLEEDVTSLSMAAVSGSIVSCCDYHFIVHSCSRNPSAPAASDVAAVHMSQLSWTSSAAINLPQFADACSASCSHARTIAFGTIGCIKVFRLQSDSSESGAAYACIRTLYLPRGMRATCMSMSAGGDHLCWCCESSCLVQVMTFPYDDEVSSPADSVPFHILHNQPALFASWLHPPGSSIRCSDIELDDVIISADVAGCILLSKLMREEAACSFKAVTCSRINVPSLRSITCVMHAPGSSMRATDSVFAFATLDASAKLVVWCAKGIVRRRLPLLAAEGVTSCFISQSMTTTLPAPSHQACSMCAWSECSISSNDDCTVDPSVLCVTAFKDPFFATSSILSAAALNCTAIAGINHRGRIVQLEAQSLGGLMLSRDVAGGAIVWSAHESSSALLPRYWASASAATLAQLRPSDTFGAAVLLSIVKEQPAEALTFDVTILIDHHTGISYGSFSEYCVSRVQISSVPAKGSTINCIKCWKPMSTDGLRTTLCCLIDTNLGVWWISFEKKAEKWAACEAQLFQECSVATCVGLSSNDDCIWSICDNGTIYRAACENGGLGSTNAASQPWAKLPNTAERSSISVDAPDSMSLCIICHTDIYMFFDCNGRACLVAQGTLPSFPNSMQCWSSCSGSIRICCVYDGSVRICSLGTECIYTQHLVHFSNSGSHLGAVLDDKFYTSSLLGLTRLDINMKNNISFSSSPRRFPHLALSFDKASETSDYKQDIENGSDSGSDSQVCVDEDVSLSSNDEHSMDPSSMSWVVPWYACLKSKADYLQIFSSVQEGDKIVAFSGLLQPTSSNSSGGDWMTAASPQPPPLAAVPSRFTNMKERRANSTIIGAMLSAYCNSKCEYMWQSGWFVAWAALNEEQPQLLSELAQIYEERQGSVQSSAGSSSNMSWACASWCGAPLWLTDTSKLSQLLMACGRAMFLATKDAMECVLIFVLVGQKNALLALMRSNRGTESNKKFQEFLASDSSDPDFRARACKNAFRLICQHRYSLACALFLLADDISSAMDVAANRLGDIMLAVAIARLHSKESSVAFSQEHEHFIVDVLGCKFPAATAALLYRQGRSEDTTRHLMLVCNFRFNHSDSNAAPVLPMLSVFDLMLFVHEFLMMPQVHRWKQQLPSLSDMCSDLSISCQQLCVLCCRMLSIASGDCVGPHVAFIMLKAFYLPAAPESKTIFMQPSLHAFFLASLCGWLELDPLDISYSMNSLPGSVVDTLMRLMHSEEWHVSGKDYVQQSVPPSLQHVVSQSRNNFFLLPSNLQIGQRWKLLMSAASANVSSDVRFAATLQACVLALCFPSVLHSDTTGKCTAFALESVQFLLANCPLSNDSECDQKMLQLCSSWLDIAYETSSRLGSDSRQAAAVKSVHGNKSTLLQLPQLDVLYDASTTSKSDFFAPVRSNSSLAPAPHSVRIHSAFWGQCIGENVLQLLQAAVSADGDIAAILQPCRMLLLQEMRSSGISLNSMNAFAFERFALPPTDLQELAAVVNCTSAISAIEYARCSALTHSLQVKPHIKNVSVYSGSSRTISNVLSCRRRVVSSGSDVTPTFGPLEEVACTREMIRSIALISALSEPCVVAAGSNFLAEIKLSPKGASVRRIAAAAPKTIESVVSTGLKKFGNSLFAKVYSIGSPTPAPSLFDEEESGSDNVLRMSSSSWNCVCSHPSFPLYVTGGNSGSQTIWSSGSSCALSHIAAPWDSAVTDSTFSHDGRLIASAFGNGGVALWEFSNSQAPPLRCMQQFTERAFKVMWLNEGSQLLCAGYSKGAGCISIIDLLSPSRSRPSDNFINSTSGISSACFVRSGSLVALGFRDGGISLCDLRMRGSVTQRDAIHGSSVRTLVAPPLGSWMASSGSDGHVQVLDSMFLNPLHKFENQHPRGTYFHSGSTSLAHFGVTDMVLESEALWTCGADGRVLRRTL